MQYDLRLRVNAGGCLIQNENPGVGKEGTGEGDELALAYRKAASPFIDFRVITVFHLHDKVVGADSFGGPDVLIPELL